MPHPAVSALLGDPLAPDVAAHVADCASCQRLVDQDQPVARAEAAGASGDLDALPRVDAALYTVRSAEQRGGMGVTYVARDRRLGREVAIKRPRSRADVGDADLHATLRARFEREARLTARLEHPAIVGVHEAGLFADGEPFYAMRLVRGTPLADEIARRTTLAERLALLPNLTTVAEALAYAHSAGITHRDVKPSNILLGAFGETVLIDWGLATATDADTGATTSSSTATGAEELPLTEYGLGTPGYMPPEQAAGHPVTHAADVYAFGATLHHLLAGAPPRGVPLAQVCPTAPAALVALVERAMATAASSRIAAQDLVAELKRFQTGSLLESHRYSPRELLAHYLKRFRVPLAIALAGALVLAVMTVLYVQRLARATRRTEVALREQLGVTASQLARVPTRVLDALVAGVRAVRPDGDEPGPDAWQGLLDALGAEPVAMPLVGHRGALTSVAFVGDRLVTAGSDRTYRVWDLPTGHPLQMQPSTIERVESLVIAPDHRHVLACGRVGFGEWVSLDAGGPPPRTFALADLDVDARCAITPDGDPVLAGGVQLRRFGVHPLEVALPGLATTIGMTAAGTAIVGLVTGELVAVGADGVLARSPVVHPGGVRGLIVAGDRVISAGVDGRAFAWTLDHEHPASPVELTEVQRDVAIYQVSALAAGIGFAGTATLNDMHSIALTLRRPAGTTTIHDFAVGAEVATDDASLVFGFSTDRARLVDAATGRDVLRLAIPVGRANVGARDTHLGVLVSTAGPTLVWDLRRGLATGTLYGHTSEVTGLALVEGALWSASLDGTVRRWAQQGAPLTIDAGAEVVALAERIAVGADGRARLYGPDGTLRAILAATGGPLGFVLPSGDGTELLAGGLRGALRRWHADTGAPSPPVPLGVSAVVTAAGTRGNVVIAGTATGELVRVVDHEVLAHGQLPDPDAIERIVVGETAIAVGMATTRTVLVDPQTLALLRTVEGHLLGAAGAVAVVALADGRVSLEPLGGGAGAPRSASLLDGHARPVIAMAATTELLATADGGNTVRVWSLATRRPLATFVAPVVGTPTALAFVDPSTLAVGGSTGVIRTLPIRPRAAVRRACATLRYFGRAAEAGCGAD